MAWAKKRKTLSPAQRAMKEATTICSLYVRVRDALKYCKKHGIDTSETAVMDLLVACCTCNKIHRVKDMQAGHYISKGAGGASGVRFDERNINTQCRHCNKWLHSNHNKYTEFMKLTYGQTIFSELSYKERINAGWPILKLRKEKMLYEKLYEDLLKNVCIRN